MLITMWLFATSEGVVTFDRQPLARLQIAVPAAARGSSDQSPKPASSRKSLRYTSIADCSNLIRCAVSVSDVEARRDPASSMQRSKDAEKICAKERSMKIVIRWTLLVFAVAFFTLAPVSFDTLPPTPDDSAFAVLNQDPGDGGTGGGCTYCDQGQCGCSAPPLGCQLNYSCGCSPIWCSRSCQYDC